MGDGMGRMRVWLCVAALVMVAAVPGSGGVVHQYVGEGEVVEVFATAEGGAAMVLLFDRSPINMREVMLRLVYVADGGVVAHEVMLPFVSRPQQVVARAGGLYVHVVVQWQETVDGLPQVHYYRWQLPSRVVRPVFLPLVGGGNGAGIEAGADWLE